MRRSNAFKLPIYFDTEPLQEELKRISADLWQPFLSNHTATYWKGVAFRSSDATPTTLTTGKVYFDSPLMEELPSFRKVIKFFQCDLKRVRLSKLEPGGIIGKHTDILPGEKISEVRMQLPIVTNKRALFTIENSQVRMRSGELWYLDVSKEHSVENNGTQPRIHLIIDCEINEWVKKQIPELNN